MNEYKQGFINGWSSALGKLGDSLNRLKGMVPDVEEDRNAGLPDPWSRIVALDNSLAAEKDLLRGLDKDNAKSQQRIAALESATKEMDSRIASTVLSNWGFVNGHDQRLRAQQSSIDEAYRRHDVLVAAFSTYRSESERRIAELEADVGRHGAKGLASSGGTAMSGLQAQIDDMWRKLQDLNTWVGQLDAARAVSVGRRDPNGV